MWSLVQNYSEIDLYLNRFFREYLNQKERLEKKNCSKHLDGIVLCNESITFWEEMNIFVKMLKHLMNFNGIKTCLAEASYLLR